MCKAYMPCMAKLEYKESASKLVHAEAVRFQVFKVAREARNALMALPDSIANKSCRQGFF